MDRTKGFKRVEADNRGKHFKTFGMVIYDKLERLSPANTLGIVFWATPKSTRTEHHNSAAILATVVSCNDLVREY